MKPRAFTRVLTSFFLAVSQPAAAESESWPARDTLTGWLRLTADLQWIDPARARFSDAWVGGLRATVHF